MLFSSPALALGGRRHRGARRRHGPAAVALLLAGLWTAPAAALPIDLHAYWDNRCLSCHGESADFARRSLRLADGRLQGAHHRADLPRFLQGHGVPADLLAPLQQMLAAQVQAAPLYRQRCAGCHDKAASFARQSLVMTGGVLSGKASGRPVANTLKTHGGLNGAELAAVLATLNRVWAEVQTQ